MRVLAGRRDDVGGPPLGDHAAHGFERGLIGGHEEGRHALVGPR